MRTNSARKKGRKNQTMKGAPLLALTAKKGALPAESSYKKAKEEKSDMEEDAAQLLFEVAKSSLMGFKALKTWAECCNQNVDALNPNITKWGGDSRVRRSLDLRLLQRATKILKRGKSMSPLSARRREPMGYVEDSRPELATEYLLVCPLLFEYRGGSQEGSRKERAHENTQGGQKSTCSYGYVFQIFLSAFSFAACSCFRNVFQMI